MPLALKCRYRWACPVEFHVGRLNRRPFSAPIRHLRRLLARRRRASSRRRWRSCWGETLLETNVSNRPGEPVAWHHSAPNGTNTHRASGAILSSRPLISRSPMPSHFARRRAAGIHLSSLARRWLAVVGRGDPWRRFSGNQFTAREIRNGRRDAQIGGQRTHRLRHHPRLPQAAW